VYKHNLAESTTVCAVQQTFAWSIVLQFHVCKMCFYLSRFCYIFAFLVIVLVFNQRNHYFVDLFIFVLVFVNVNETAPLSRKMQVCIGHVAIPGLNLLGRAVV